MAGATDIGAILSMLTWIQATLRVGGLLSGKVYRTVVASRNRVRASASDRQYSVLARLKDSG